MGEAVGATVCEEYLLVGVGNCAKNIFQRRFFS